MPASIACAKAGVTTGEWGAVFREVFGEYRAPTGDRARRAAVGEGWTRCAPRSSGSRTSSADA